MREFHFEFTFLIVFGWRNTGTYTVFVNVKGNPRATSGCDTIVETEEQTLVRVLPSFSFTEFCCALGKSEITQLRVVHLKV